MIRIKKILSITAVLAAMSGVAGMGWAAQTAKAPRLPEKLDLETVLRYALDNNFSIRQAKERIKEQDGLVIQVTAQAMPRLSLDADYGLRGNELLPTGASSNRDWGISLNARQALYAGGGVRAGIDAGRLLREAAVLDLQTVINDALLDVRIKFYNALLARDQIVVQEGNVKLYEEQLQNVRNRHAAGTVSNFEVLRAEVVLANAKPALIRARNDYRVALDLLRQAAGYEGGEDLNQKMEVIGALTYTPETYDLHKAISMAREMRPELKGLERMIGAREKNVTVQKSGYRPTLDLVAGYDYMKATGSESFRRDEAVDGWRVGVVSSWAIFDGRATAGKVAQAKSQLTQVELSYSEQHLSVEVEVRHAFSMLQEADELVDAARKVVEQAVEALRLANARYSAGSGTQLDVLQAQVELTNARDNQLQAHYSYNVALANIRKAVGIADRYAVEQ